jgi:ligand-binding sensor domain-containing protein/signal transduction histidine kinase
LKSLSTCRDDRLLNWLLASVVLLCLAHTASAIDPVRELSQYIRDQWGSAKGFPGGQVYAIAQTRDGYLWIGAEKGLVRFDGLKFHLFQHANTPVIPVGPIRSLVADTEGGLWIHFGGPRIVRYLNGKFEDVASLLPQSEPAFTAMGRGANGDVLLSALVNGTLQYRDGKFVKVASAPDLPNFLVISLAESPEGKLWLGTRDLGLFYATQGNISNISKPLPDLKINCLLPISNEELWIGTDNGVVRWNGVEVTTAGLSASLTHVQALTMIKDRDGNVWVGTNNGLIRVGPLGNVAFPKGANNSVPVTALFEDREGSIWSGTAQGIERLRDSIFVTYSAGEGIPAENNGPVHVDFQGRVWFGPTAGGLYSLNGGTVERVNNDGLNNDVIYSITGDRTGLWIGRQKGGLTHLSHNNGSYKTKTYTEAQGLSQNSVYAVHQNRDGSVWAGTLSGGVSHFSGGKFSNYTTRNGLASNMINAIVESADGTMWFATPNGLTALSNGRWQTFKLQDGLPSDRVNCLFEDSTGLLWLGTEDGLAFLDSGRFQTPPRVAAALNEPVLGLVADATGALWITTTDHVLRVALDRLRSGQLTEADVSEFGVADGLPGSQGVRRNRSVTQDPSGMVWFSLSTGLSVVNPSALKRSSVPAIVHISAITVDGRGVDLNGNIRIPSARQRITFSFVGLSLAIPERVKFRYRLDGFDPEWSAPVSAGEAIYTNLSPGSYRFHVMASNSDGSWNSAPAELAFEIEPALWQTWWFRLSGLLAIGLLGFAFYRMRLLQLTRQLNVRFEERLIERTRIAQELHDTLLQGFLSASMQLDVAVDQLPESSPLRPRLVRILDLMRQVTEEGRNALRGLRLSSNNSENIEVALSNINQELNSDGQTVFRVIVEGSSRALHPIVRDEVYRIGREAVANAFRHARAKNIAVEVGYLQSQLRLLISDDGCGINPEVLEFGREGHWGLSGMRERAERINARLKVRSRVGSGTEVELSIPSAVAFQDQPGRSSKWLSRLFRHKAPTISTEAGKEAKQ